MIPIERHVIYTVLAGLAFGTLSWFSSLTHNLVIRLTGNSSSFLLDIAGAIIWCLPAGVAAWLATRHGTRASVGALISTAFLLSACLAYYLCYLAEISLGSVQNSGVITDDGPLVWIRSVIDARVWDMVGPELSVYVFASLLVGPPLGWVVGSLSSRNSSVASENI